MKELILILVVLTSTTAMNRFGSPSPREMNAARWHRQARAEREQMTRELLTMRNDINDRLEMMEQEDGGRTNAHEQRLENLRARLESENRDLQHYAVEANELGHDSWLDVKGRAKRQITQVKRELLRVQKGVENAISSNERN
jgi:hypothetical protein